MDFDSLAHIDTIILIHFILRAYCSTSSDECLSLGILAGWMGRLTMWYTRSQILLKGSVTPSSWEHLVRTWFKQSLTATDMTLSRLWIDKNLLGSHTTSTDYSAPSIWRQISWRYPATWSPAGESSGPGSCRGIRPRCPPSRRAPQIHRVRTKKGDMSGRLTLTESVTMRESFELVILTRQPRTPLERLYSKS